MQQRWLNRHHFSERSHGLWFTGGDHNFSIQEHTVAAVRNGVWTKWGHRTKRKKSYAQFE